MSDARAKLLKQTVFFDMERELRVTAAVPLRAIPEAASAWKAHPKSMWEPGSTFAACREPRRVDAAHTPRPRRIGRGEFPERAVCSEHQRRPIVASASMQRDSAASTSGRGIR